MPTIITFANDAERKLWVRLLHLDDERCWEKAQRRRARKDGSGLPKPSKTDES